MTRQMLRRLRSAEVRSGEPSGCFGKALLIRSARPQSSLRVRFINSVIVSDSMFPPSSFDRANRGLLVEAPATEAAGASLATGTKWRSASALAPMPTTVPKGRKKDAIGAVEDRGKEG